MGVKKEKQQNAYHVKLRVTPPYPYKPFFVQGIAFAPNPKEANETAISRIKEWAKIQVEWPKTPIEGIEVTHHSTKKLRNDFQFDTRKL